MDLNKFGIKFFAQDAQAFDILKLIPVYHRWIQRNALEDLLIDVADYSHVPSGPGVMLIAHEGNYALDETGHERGVVYYSKQKLAGDLPERFAHVAQRALQAAELMREDAELEPFLKAFLDRLYDGAPYTLTRESDPKERLSVRVQTDRPVELKTLLGRLS